VNSIGGEDDAVWDQCLWPLAISGCMYSVALSYLINHSQYSVLLTIFWLWWQGISNSLNTTHKKLWCCKDYHHYLHRYIDALEYITIPYCHISLLIVTIIQLRWLIKH